MALNLALALYAIALLELWLRRPGRREGDEAKAGAERFGALRPLLPTYRFFDSIGDSLWLGIRQADSSEPYQPLSPPPRRRPWFLFESGRENLWLHEQSKLPKLAELFHQGSPLALREAEALVLGQLRRAKCDGHLTSLDLYECVLLRGTGDAAETLGTLLLAVPRDFENGELRA